MSSLVNPPAPKKAKRTRLRRTRRHGALRTRQAPHITRRRTLRHPYPSTHKPTAPTASPPCVTRFEQLLRTAPKRALARLPGMRREHIQFGHPKVRVQFSTWLSCPVQYMLHKGLHKGEQTYFPFIARMARRYHPSFTRHNANETALVHILQAQITLESMLNTHAVSHAGAAGPWQFMPATFERYRKKLKMPPQSVQDLRFDWHVSTRAALELTHDNLRTFAHTRSPMTCALMAYNGGASGIKRIMGRQGQTDCRALRFSRQRRGKYLHRETYEYTPRIVLILMLMSWRKAYGYNTSESRPQA